MNTAQADLEFSATLVALKAEYQRLHGDVFSPAELARLQFVHWLLETGRIER